MKKGPRFPATLVSNQGRTFLVALLALVLLAVVLDPRHPQTGHAAAVDGPLPAGELLEAERVALAGFVDGQQATGDGGDHFRPAAHDPAGGGGRRQRVERQRLAERADYLGWPDLLVLEHYKTSKPIDAC